MEQDSLEASLKVMRRAARKKASLAEFLQENHVTFSQHATIAQMLAIGEKTIASRFEPQAHEELGFGKYGDLTYQQVWDQHPSYVKWVKETMETEDNPGWRLQRFHRWATRAHHQQKHTQGVKITKKKGYPGEPSGSEVSFSMISSAHSSEADAMSAEIQRQWEELEKQRLKLKAKEEEVQAAEEALKEKIGDQQLTHKNRKEM